MADELPPLRRVASLPSEGACWNCGFLCHKDEHNRHISSYSELTPHNREWARFYPFWGVWAPWCFRWEPIQEEITEKLGGRTPRVVIQDERVEKEQNAAALEVVTRDRQCSKWTKYKPGRGPKEHWDELVMHQLEESQQRFEEALEQGRREWEEARERDRREFEERMDARADEREKERHNWGLRLTLAALALAFVEVAGTILGLPVITRLLRLD